MSNDFVSLLGKAQQQVESSPLWKRFIDGTPLAYDIAVWMANFALEAALSAQPAKVARVDTKEWQRNSRDFPNCPNLGCPCEPKGNHAAGELVDEAQHARMIVGPSAHHHVRLQKAAYHLARAAFGTETETDDRRVYWAIQAYVHSAAAQPAERQGAVCFDCYGIRYINRPAAPVGVPDVRVDKQGVRFGDGCWYSHERITGVSADLLNEGKCSITAREYMNWVQKHLAAAPSAPQGVDHE
jgi:hypothetical protein